jgi:hypothetical protein
LSFAFIAFPDSDAAPGRKGKQAGPSPEQIAAAQIVRGSLGSFAMRVRAEFS